MSHNMSHNIKNLKKLMFLIYESVKLETISSEAD